MPIILSSADPGTTLADLIAQVSDHIGDRETGTLTSAASTTSVTASGLTDPAGHWTGARLALTSGALAGQERRITNHASNGVFTVNAFSSTPAGTETFELRREPDHTRERVKSLINEAIRDLRKHFWVRLDSRTDLADVTVYDEDKPEYTIPASMLYVHKVLWQDTDDTAGGTPWYELPLPLWRTLGNGKLYIEPYTLKDLMPLKFLGCRRPAELSAEAGVCEVPDNYPVWYAVKNLAFTLARKGLGESDQYLRLYTVAAEEAKQARESVRETLPPSSRRAR